MPTYLNGFMLEHLPLNASWVRWKTEQINKTLEYLSQYSLPKELIVYAIYKAKSGMLKQKPQFVLVCAIQ